MVVAGGGGCGLKTTCTKSIIYCDSGYLQNLLMGCISNGDFEEEDIKYVYSVYVGENCFKGK